MCWLLMKCAALIVMIHGFRALGRLAGPRWSALALGLPSTTAIALIACGCERGTGAATTMAEASLLGLVAAVALPLVYAWAVQRNHGLPSALATAVACYLALAFAFGCLPPPSLLMRVGCAACAILAGSYGARQIAVPGGNRAGVPLSAFRTMALRTAIPLTYVLVLALVQRGAGPSWAGLVSTFPSLSLMMLAVTHLEAGPAEASRMARVLPAGNSSTLAFLTTFHLASTQVGICFGMLAGYAAAAACLILVERGDRILGFLNQRLDDGRAYWHFRILAWPLELEVLRRRMVVASGGHPRRPPRYVVPRRPRHRGRFAPRLETLAW
jgi:uncharacterized membrane protein (GlpM family)